MARTILDRLVSNLAFYSFGIFSFFLYLALSLRSGEFFRKFSEKDRLQYDIVRDQLWNLAKSPIPGFSHYFHTLRNGLRLHYIANKQPREQSGNLVIFMHGFPDSCMMWRYVLQEPAIPVQEATIVCVDLPGYGGSDSLEKYDTQVLEALTEYVVAMRDTYLLPEENGRASANTYIVGHDWGCVLAFRLASEAPSLADRFILSNGPHAELMIANRDRILHSTSKIFKQFRQSPRKNFGCLSKSLRTLGPLLFQVLLFGYQFAFHLPYFLVTWLGTGGNYAFVRGAHGSAHGEHKAEYKMMESLAVTFGPGEAECKHASSSNMNGAISEGYGESVLRRAKSEKEAWWQMTRYYTDGVAYQPWAKDLQTIADLYALDNDASQSSSPMRRRSSSSASSALLSEIYKGALRAPATILWGEKDQACTKAICLDGIGDYLAKDSEVTLLPRSGHWTPIEQESRGALAKVIGMYAKEGNQQMLSVPKYVADVYEGATLMVRK